MATWIVFRRELAQYFTSAFAYVIAAAVLLFTGVVFSRDLLDRAVETTPVNPALIPETLSLTLLFFAPLLTMRLFAEEKREGTLELLMTAPVPEGALVIGKFLGAWAYFTILLLLTLVYQVILGSLTAPDFGHTACAYIGIWLYGGAALAVGLLYSSLTENQIVAAFLGVITLFVLYVGDLAGQLIGNIEVARFIRALSLQGHFSTSFAAGLLRAEDAAFYAGVTVIMLFVTIRVVEAERYRV
jgi:ABC-2 type transport system permease protein